MEDWRNRNPGADRRLWNEPQRERGRKFVWWIGLPLVAGMIAFGAMATDHHVFANLPFLGGQALAADGSAQASQPPAVNVAPTLSPPTPKPATSTNKRGTAPVNKAPVAGH